MKPSHAYLCALSITTSFVIGCGTILATIPSASGASDTSDVRTDTARKVRALARSSSTLGETMASAQGEAMSDDIPNSAAHTRGERFAATADLRSIRPCQTRASVPNDGWQSTSQNNRCSGSVTAGRVPALSPAFTTSDQRDCTRMDVVESCFICVILGGRSDASHLLFGQLGEAVGFSSKASSLSDHICHVFEASPQKQVSRVYARRDIALVTNIHARSDRAMFDLPCDSVGSKQYGPDPHMSISLSGLAGSPRPALASRSDGNFAPKTMSQDRIDSSHEAPPVLCGQGIGPGLAPRRFLNFTTLWRDRGFASWSQDKGQQASRHRPPDRKERDPSRDISLVTSLQGVRPEPAGGGSPSAAGSYRLMARNAAALCGITSREDVGRFMRLIARESGWRHYGPDGRVLRSSSGALGLGQVKPATAQDFAPTDIREPFGNLLVSACLLQSYYQRRGSWREAVLDYRLGRWRTRTTLAAHAYADSITKDKEAAR